MAWRADRGGALAFGIFILATAWGTSARGEETASRGGTLPGAVGGWLVGQTGPADLVGVHTAFTAEGSSAPEETGGERWTSLHVRAAGTFAWIAVVPQGVTARMGGLEEERFLRHLDDTTAPRVDAPREALACGIATLGETYSAFEGGTSIRTRQVRTEASVAAVEGTLLDQGIVGPWPEGARQALGAALGSGARAWVALLDVDSGEGETPPLVMTGRGAGILARVATAFVTIPRITAWVLGPGPVTVPGAVTLEDVAPLWLSSGRSTYGARREVVLTSRVPWLVEGARVLGGHVALGDPVPGRWVSRIVGQPTALPPKGSWEVAPGREVPSVVEARPSPGMCGAPPRTVVVPSGPSSPSPPPRVITTVEVSESCGQGIVGAPSTSGDDEGRDEGIVDDEAVGDDDGWWWDEDEDDDSDEGDDTGDDEGVSGDEDDDGDGSDTFDDGDDDEDATYEDATFDDDGTNDTPETCRVAPRRGPLGGPSPVSRVTLALAFLAWPLRRFKRKRPA